MVLILKAATASLPVSAEGREAYARLIRRISGINIHNLFENYPEFTAHHPSLSSPDPVYTNYEEWLQSKAEEIIEKEFDRQGEKGIILKRGICPGVSLWSETAVIVYRKWKSLLMNLQRKMSTTHPYERIDIISQYFET